jgi:ribosomal protein S18 acetylase RimI-like enzyme
MRDAALRVARAHADPTDISLANEWAVVADVPCQHIAMPHPWATTARVLAVPTPPTAGAVAEVSAWLADRSPVWSLLVRLADEAAFTGFQQWELMPVLRLVGRPRSRPGPPVEVGPAHNPEEFLVAYGAEHAPQVTEAHLAAHHMHHLVARIDGEPVGCARVRLLGDTAYVGAVTVRPAWQRRGIGSALTLTASDVGATYTDLVWLHCSEASRALYEQLGYRHIDDHALLVPLNQQHT